MDSKEYFSFEQAVKEFEPYEIVDYGLAWIKPKKIIALSLPANQIINDEKMNRLKSLVNINGWNDPYPISLYLYRLPNGNYSVCSGGNHRAYLSNILNIPLIQANVSILIPFYIISKETKEELEYLLIKKKEYFKEACEINEWLYKIDIHRSKNLKEEKIYREKIDLSDKMQELRDKRLLAIATRFKLLPDNQFLLKIRSLPK